MNIYYVNHTICHNDWEERGKYPEMLFKKSNPHEKIKTKHKYTYYWPIFYD